MREAVEVALERHWPGESSQPMILPIEWRSALTLDDGETDVVTLPKMGNMRHALNASAMDIMQVQASNQKYYLGTIKVLSTARRFHISLVPVLDCRWSGAFFEFRLQPIHEAQSDLQGTCFAVCAFAWIRDIL